MQPVEKATEFHSRRVEEADNGFSEDSIYINPVLKAKSQYLEVVEDISEEFPELDIAVPKMKDAGEIYTETSEEAVDLDFEQQDFPF